MLIQEWFGIKAKRPATKKDEKPSVLAVDKDSKISSMADQSSKTIFAKLAKKEENKPLEIYFKES